MQKVLIIDDEILAIKYLKSLPSWEKYGCTDLFHALTTAGAMDLFRREKPQIVFVDIRMPGTNGLELSRRLLKENPDISIVIMTAYQEFEYVKEAMQIGIKYFLVKHEITESTLDDVLEKIAAGFHSRQRYKNVLWNDWLRKIWDGEVSENLSPPNENPCFFLIFSLRGLSVLKGEEEPVLLKESSIRELTFEHIRMKAFSRLGAFTYALICEYDRPASEKENQRALEEFTGQLTERCLEECGLHPVFFLSDIHQSCDAFAPLCPVLKTLSEGWLARRTTLIREEDFTKYQRLYPNALYPDLPPESWQATELAGMLAVIQSGRGYLDTADLLPLRQYIHANISSSFLEQEDRKIRLVSIEQILRAVLRFLEKPQAAKESRQNSRIIQQALSFIHLHYAENISSGVIADALHVSDGYLRLLFKRELSCTVKDYILNYRIEAAKKMLLENRKKTYEIAAMCGFASSQHFSRVFRKVTGTAPGEYRRQDGGENIDQKIHRI